MFGSESGEGSPQSERLRRTEVRLIERTEVRAPIEKLLSQNLREELSTCQSAVRLWENAAADGGVGDSLDADDHGGGAHVDLVLDHDFMNSGV